MPSLCTSDWGKVRTGTGTACLQGHRDGFGSVTGAERSGTGGRPRTDGRPTAHDSGTGTGAGTADPPQQDGHSKTAKNQTRTAQVRPPLCATGRFRTAGGSACGVGNPNTKNTYCKKLYLCPMSIIIENRLTIGFALGFAYYGPDSEYDYHELTLYLGLISVIFKT